METAQETAQDSKIMQDSNIMQDSSTQTKTDVVIVLSSCFTIFSNQIEG